jgi:hypothetical protein
MNFNLNFIDRDYQKNQEPPFQRTIQSKNKPKKAPIKLSVDLSSSIINQISLLKIVSFKK